jgi:hypothetical protein
MVSLDQKWRDGLVERSEDTASRMRDRIHEVAPES